MKNYITRKRMIGIFFLLLIIVLFVIGSKIGFESYDQGDYVYYDPVNNKKCDRADYWTTYNNDTNCYRWVVLRDGLYLKLVLDHNYVFENDSEYIKYKDIDNTIQSFQKRWKNVRVSSFSLNDALKFLELNNAESREKLDAGNRIQDKQYNGLLGFDNFSYDKKSGQMIEHKGSWLSDTESKAAYIINDKGEIEAVNKNEDRVGIRPVIKILRNKVVYQGNMFKKIYDDNDENSSKKLMNTLSRDQILGTFNERGLRALTSTSDSGKMVSDITRFYSGSTSLLNKSLGSGSTNNLYQGYWCEAFVVRDNKFLIYFYPGATVTTDKRHKVLTLNYTNGSFDDGSLSDEINCGHGNDATYNSNTNKLVVADNGSTDSYVFRTGTTFAKACVSTNKPLNIVSETKNNITVINDRYIIPSGRTKATCEEVSGNYTYDYCTKFINSGNENHTGIVMADGKSMTAYMGLTRNADIAARQTLEYHDGYLYKVYSEANDVAKGKSTAMIHVINAKLKKNGKPSDSYGKSVVLYYDNFLNSKLLASSSNRDTMEIEAVSFPNDTSDTMYMLFNARKEAAPKNRKPYIYKMTLSKVTSNADNYYYGTTVNYYDDNTTPDKERYYWNENVDLDYYVLGNKHLGWIYSRTGTGATNISNTYKAKSASVTTTTSSTVKGITVNLKTVKLESSKYSNITSTTATTVTDSTIQAFLEQLSCTRCTGVVLENGTEKTSGYFIKGNTYQLKIKADDTNKTQALLKTITPTIYSVTIPTNSLCASKTYTGSEQQLTSVTSGSGYTLSGYNGTNAGTYTITATLQSGNVWTDGTTGNKTFNCTMNKKPITVSASNQSKKYDGSALNADSTCTVTSGSLVSGHNVACTSTGSQTNVGSSAKTLSTVLITNESTDVSNNYEVTKENGTLTVNADSVTIPTASLCESRTYTGSEQQLTSITSASGYTLSGYNGTNAGTYTITATLQSGNVWSDNTTENKTFKCTMSKKKVTVTASNQSKIYDGSALSANSTCTVTSGSLVSGDTVTCTNNGSQTVVGTSPKTITTVVVKNSNSVDVSNNYEIEKVHGTLTVNKAEAVCPSIESYKGTYDGQSHTITATGEVGGVLQYRTSTEGEWSSTKPVRTIAGVTTVYVQVKGDSNHNDKDCGSKTIEIDKKGIEIPEEGSYCKSGLVYNGSSQTLVKAAGEGYSFSNSEATNAGDHEVKVNLSDTSNTKWIDNTTGEKEITCSIAKAVPVVTLSATRDTISIGELSKFNEKASVKGKFTVSSSNTSVATVTQASDNEIGANTNNLVTVVGEGEGEAVITVGFTPTDNANYNQAEAKEYIVNVEATPVTPTYNISYNLNGGEVSGNPTQYEKNGEAIRLNNPEKRGYRFIGWTGSNGSEPELEVTIAQGETGDKEYTANYEPIEYMITYNLEGGAANNPVSYNIETKTFSLSAPKKTGYRFIGWTGSNGSEPELEVTIAKGEIGAKTYTANYEIVNYFITYNLNGGLVSGNPTSYNIRTEDFTLNNPSKEGHTFKGWTGSNGSIAQKTVTIVKGETGDKEYNANYDTDKYTITFNSNGGSYVTPIEALYGKAVEKPGDPVKEGYTFAGWYSDSELINLYNFSTMPAHDVMLYAKWEANTYTITFDSNGGSSVEEIEKPYGTTITQPEDPVKEGYKFAGWYSDSELENLYSFSTMPAENITLYAKWTNNSYVISYELDGGVNDEFNPTSYKTGEEKILNDATKEGYIFKGWYKESSHTTKVERISADMHEDITLYAAWEANTYTITFDSNGGSSVEKIEKPYGTTITKPEDPVKEGYIFAGWYSDRELTNLYNFTTMPAENITLYAKWSNNTVVVNFVTNGGTSIPEVRLIKGEKLVNVLEPEREGHTFKGWYSDSGLTQEYDFNKEVNENMILYAKWEINKYTVTFESNGGSRVSSQTVVYGNKVTQPENPEKDGYRFTGWYKDTVLATEYNFDDIVENDITLYAAWEAKEYTISFNSNGGSRVEAITALYGEEIVKPKDPEREGYKFVGWYKDSSLSEMYSFSRMPKENITLYAKWEKRDYYVIRYELDGGENDEGNATRYKAGDKIVLKDAKREGYNFKGWYLDRNYEHKIERITAGMHEDITLYAKWEAKEYTVKYILDAEEYEIDKVLYGKEVNVVIPKKEGHTFKGWYVNEGMTILYDASSKVEKDITLYGYFEANKYRITFDSNKGSRVSVIEKIYGEEVEKPNDPVRKGYRFAGWYSDKELTKLYSFTTMPAKDITLYAKWVSNDYYVIEYETDGGENNSLNPTSYKEGENIEIKGATKDDSEFKGWYTKEGERITNTKQLKGDTVLYAKWKEGNSIYVPDTGSKVSIISTVAGVMLIVGGGYILYKKRKIT